MKKIVLGFAALALIFGVTSCASTGGGDDLAMPEGLEDLQVEETASLPYTAVDEAVTGDSYNTLSSLGSGVTIVVNQDISKDPPVDVQGAAVSVVELYGEKCLMVTPNFGPEIRVAFKFDEPISAEGLKTLKYSVTGFDGDAGAYNCGIMYEDMNGAEHLASFYLSSIASDAWTDVTADVTADEQWGNNFNASRKVIAVQFWSGSKEPLFIKGLELSK